MYFLNPIDAIFQYVRFQQLLAVTVCCCALLYTVYHLVTHTAICTCYTLRIVKDIFFQVYRNMYRTMEAGIGMVYQPLCIVSSKYICLV